MGQTSNARNLSSPPSNRKISTSSSLGGIIHSLSPLLHPFLWPLATISFLMLLKASLELAGPYVFGAIVNEVAAHVPFATTLPLVVLSLGIYLCGLVLRWSKDVVELKYLTYDFPSVFATASVAKLLSLSLGQHKANHSGVIQSSIDRGQSAVRTVLSMFLNEFLPFAFQVIPAVIALVYIDWRSAAIVVGGLMIFCTLTIVAGKRLITPMRTLRQMQSRDTKFYSDILRNISVIQLAGREHQVTAEYKDQLEGTATFGKSVWRRLLVQTYTILVQLGVARTLVTLVALRLACSGAYPPGTFIVILMWSGTALNGLSVISSMHRRIIELVADIKEYASIVAMRPDIVNVQGGIQPPIRGQIEFHNVSFNYTRATSTTLRDVSRRETWNPGVQNVNIHIKSGERVAFVGCSGAGKTTLASLLLRAYDPDQGTIRIDGHDLKSLDLSHYRRSIGVVEQQVTLFDNSIVYNILMGVPEGRPFTQQDINVALRTSYLHPFVVSLEQGLNTLVGENGKRLSGGQCQRIAIARALICPRSILIFDESTAHIDPQTESLVVDAIDQHAPNSTCIFIAHRLSLMTRVQRIYVFDKGELVGVGHHDELLATCSKYRELVREQENYTHTSHTILENRYADDNGFTSLSEMEREHRPIMCAILGGLKNLRARKFSQEITLLDLGCGNGALLRSVSRQAPGVHCFGIDIDPEKIERGRTLLGVPQVYLAQGNICNPSDEWFTTPKFDIVLVNAAFLVLPGNERLWSWLGRHADLIYAYAYVADGNREWAAISACSDVGVRLEIMEPVIAGETMVWIASRVGNCEVNSNLVQYGQLTNEI